MSIKVWDYKKEFEIEKEEIFKAVEKVFESGRLIFGKSLESFEENFSTYCQTAMGIGVDNGTNAIFLALKALNLPEKSEIITVSNTAVPTVSAIVSAGHIPKFVDIDLDTYLMDTSMLDKAINSKTKCIIPVHLYGQCVEMDPVLEIAKKNNLFVIEDCAQGHGAEYRGKKAGSMGDMGAFSFYPTKPLGGYGDAGMITTNNEEYALKLKRLRFYGMENVYYAEEHGYNSRLDDIHAAILDVKLKKLDNYIDKRRILAKRYNERLNIDDLIIPSVAKKNKHVFYIYVCRHPKRDMIVDELKKHDIYINISYPWPIHTMRGYSFLGNKVGDLPKTELACSQIFSLPMYPQLTLEEVDRVCDVLENILVKD